MRHILAKFSLWASARPKRSLRFTEQKSPCGNGKLLKMRQTASETAFVLSIISKKALHTFIKLPADMSLTLSKGFHNAPLIYNDHLVKPCPQVTGLGPALKRLERYSKHLVKLYSAPKYCLTHRYRNSKTACMTASRGYIVNHYIASSTAVLEKFPVVLLKVWLAFLLSL